MDRVRRSVGQALVRSPNKHVCHAKKRKQHPVIKDCQEQRKTVRKLGYKSTEEYEQGLSVIRRLLAKKGREGKAKG
jgi:hypothetical protein